MNDIQILKENDPTLTEDDLKVIKHLKSIDNLFKRGNLTISMLFANAGTLQVLKEYNGLDYAIADFNHITCDGGDPDNYGKYGVHPYSEWIDLMENNTVHQIEL